MHGTSVSSLGLARTFLFVPGDRQERLARALASGADAVIVDLEDAVSPERKAEARALVDDGFAGLPATAHARLLVRMNAADTPWHGEDRALLGRLAAHGRLAGVVLPKAERSADLAALARDVGPAVALLPLVESVAGLDAVDALAVAPQVLRLIFGHLDFQADAGLACGADESELVPVRLALVLATRRAGLAPPVDGVTADWRDVARLASDAARARRGGFGAKLCIHPDQVAGVQATFTPGADELTWARRVRDAVGAAGGGVVNVDGKMVDAPILKLAERLLAQASETT
ncbi:MAG: CoA ester lyase [Variovorax sp.]|nr:MAG: CoA ester lyase [Variovorax sp.]